MPDTHYCSSGMAIIGDTQRSMLYQILLGEEVNNHSERTTLIEGIRKLMPEAVILLGDLVAYGHSKNDWKYFDSIMAPLLNEKIEIIPVVGNHDYFFNLNQSRIHLKKRFPVLKDKTYHSRIWDKIGIIFIDSNQNVLKSTWNDQIYWIEDEIRRFEKDNSIEGIIICGHHPPFTNSRRISPHQPTRADILPLFMKSPKTIAFFSGHCHAYERFVENKKVFVVSGGGGGPRQKLHQGIKMRYNDQFKGKELRPFHFIFMIQNSNFLQFEVKGIEKGQTNLDTIDRFEIKLTTKDQ